MSKLIVISSVFVAACVANTEIETSTTQEIGASACPAGVPADIAPAPDQDLAFGMDASGKQIYTCNAAGAWVFVAPDAAVYRGNQTFIHHYAGPTWEWLDGSTVVGARAAGVTVDGTAIPWLLLTAKSHGPIVGKMTNITAIQRVNTTGGLAPTRACSPGENEEVDYTAVYLFYRTKTDHPENNTRCGA